MLHNYLYYNFNLLCSETFTMSIVVDLRLWCRKFLYSRGLTFTASFSILFLRFSTFQNSFITSELYLAFFSFRKNCSEKLRKFLMDWGWVIFFQIFSKDYFARSKENFYGGELSKNVGHHNQQRKILKFGPENKGLKTSYLEFIY